MPSVESPSTEYNQESASIDQNEKLRRVLNQALGAVLGRQLTESFSAITYEELASAQIARIEGVGTAVRPCELEQVDRIEADLLNLVEQVRNRPPEDFLSSDASRDVNTPVAPSE